MSLFTDILAGLPENAVLRMKVRDAETRYAALETENAILKDKLRDANAKIVELKKQVEKLTHSSDLDETDILLLKEIALAGTNPVAEYLAGKLSLGLALIELHLHRLIDIDYLAAWSIGGPDRAHSQFSRKLNFVLG